MGIISRKMMALRQKADLDPDCNIYTKKSPIAGLVSIVYNNSIKQGEVSQKLIKVKRKGRRGNTKGHKGLILDRTPFVSFAIPIAIGTLRA
jgi:hypothetical protein